MFTSVVFEKQYLIELPVQYEYVALSNGRIILRSRIDDSYNRYYQENQGNPSTNLQQQHSSFTGYEYEVPQSQLPPVGLIRPSITTTTPPPTVATAPVPEVGQVYIDGNVIKSLVG